MKTLKTVCQNHAANLETLKRAFREDRVCLIETQVVATGEVVATLATFTNDRDDTIFTPFCIFLNGNPYEMLRPPNPDGPGFLEADS